MMFERKSTNSLGCFLYFNQLVIYNFLEIIILNKSNAATLSNIPTRIVISHNSVP